MCLCLSLGWGYRCILQRWRRAPGTVPQMPVPHFVFCSLSLLGISVLAQLAALLQGTVPLGLLLAARVLHFVFLQGLLHLCIPLVPGQAAVFTSLAPQVVVTKRTAWDTALAIAFFLCAALYQLYKTCQSSYNNTIPAAHRSRADGPR